MPDHKTIKHQLIYLFICNFTILFVGMGLFPLLPLYAAKFGASSTMIGLYLATTYIAISTGSMIGGQLAQRTSLRAAFFFSGCLGALSLILMGQAVVLWQVVVLTGLLWFSGGVGLTLVTIMTGLYASDESRGKSFSMMSLATPLGAILGGATIGGLVKWQGYPLMFLVVGLLFLAIPLTAIFGLKNKVVKPSTSVSPVLSNSLPQKGIFYGLLFVSLLVATAMNVGRFGTSISMSLFEFTPSQVASTATVSGLATIPVVLLIGTLSDMFGRKRMLITGYILTGLGVLMLVSSTLLWHFWVSATLLLVSRCVTQAVGSAFATDLLGPDGIKRGLPYLNAISWAAGVISFAGAGYLFDVAGTTVVYIASALMTGWAAWHLYHLNQPVEMSEWQRHAMSIESNAR